MPFWEDQIRDMEPSEDKTTAWRPNVSLLTADVFPVVASVFAGKKELGDGYQRPGGYSEFLVTGMIEGIFWGVGKFWQVFFYLSRDFFGYLEQSEDSCRNSRVSRLRSSSENFYGLEIRHGIFWGLNFCPGIFWVLFEALGIFLG